MVNIRVEYDSEMRGIVAHLQGRIDLADIEKFKILLLHSIHRHLFNRTFPLLLNTYGYQPLSTQVHSTYSRFLKTSKLLNSQCRKVAHVHHSQKHIDDWLPFMDEFQGFFTDFEEARFWLMKDC